MLVKFLLGTILVLACNLPVQALPVYSSGLADRREFCLKVEATAKAAVEENYGLSEFQSLAALPVIKSLSKFDQTTLFDALYGAKQRNSFWWVYNFCMDRVES